MEFVNETFLRNFRSFIVSKGKLCMQTKYFKIYDKKNQIIDHVTTNEPWKMSAEERRAYFNTAYLSLE